jgi:hypothetical protein
MVESQSKTCNSKRKPELTGKGLISIYLTFDQLQQLWVQKFQMGGKLVKHTLPKGRS